MTSFVNADDRLVRQPALPAGAANVNTSLCSIIVWCKSMKSILRGFGILNKDGWKALMSSILGRENFRGVADERLAKALGQRDDARSQRDKTRVERDKLREEVATLRIRVAEIEEQRETQIDARQELADAIDLKLPHDDPALQSTLLKRELTAESARVQALERNLDRVLRRNTELESRLSRMRAMLAVLIDEGDIDAHAVTAELAINRIDSAANRIDSAAALSQALFGTIRDLQRDSAAASPNMPRNGIGLASASPTTVAKTNFSHSRSSDLLTTETPDAIGDLRPIPGSWVDGPSIEPFGASATTLDEDTSVGGDVRPTTGSLSHPIDKQASVARGVKDVAARLPEPAILKGKLLTPSRAKKVFEERHLQINSFIADGEYERIQALKDVHKGRRAFIVGNGPSLELQDLSKLDGEITFVANWFANHQGFDLIKPFYYAISSHEMFGGWARQNPVLNASFIDKLTRHDHKPEMFFSHRFRNALRQEPALESYERRFLVFDRPKFLADEVGGLQFDLGQPMHDGYTVLLTFCVPLAVHMGINEIYMVGCDCDYGVEQDPSVRNYFYAPSEHATSSTKTESIKRIWAENGPLFRVYELAREECATRGVKMFNATAGGRLEVLPRVNYDEVLNVRPMAARA